MSLLSFLFVLVVLTPTSLLHQGEMSFEQDCLVEGGCLGEMHNGTEYREVRQFQSAHHLVRFYFVTRIYSRYMQSVLEDFRNGLKPDVVIVNSCIWDVSRWVCEEVTVHCSGSTNYLAIYLIFIISKSLLLFV